MKPCKLYEIEGFDDGRTLTFGDVPDRVYRDSDGSWLFKSGEDRDADGFVGSRFSLNGWSSCEEPKDDNIIKETIAQELIGKIIEEKIHILFRKQCEIIRHINKVGNAS